FQGTVQHRERQTLGQNLGQQRTADRRFKTPEYWLPLALIVFFVLVQTYGDTALQLDVTVIVSALNFGQVHEEQAFALAIDALPRGVVQTQHDVLRRHDGRLAVGGEQHVVRCQHQGTRFQLGFERQRHVNGHLVTVEVGVEGRANQRVQLNGLAFDQHRLKSLNTQTVQRGCTVEHDRMFTNDFFKNIPDYRFLTFDQLLRGLDRGRQAHHFKTIENEGLEQFQCHQFGQAALMQLELRTHHDDRTA